MVPGVRHPEYVIQLWSNPPAEYSCSHREQKSLRQDFTRHRFFGWISPSKIRPLRAPIPCFSGPGGNNSRKNGNNSGCLYSFYVGDREVTISSIWMAKTDKGQGFAFPGGVYLIVRAWQRFGGRRDFTTENGGGGGGQRSRLLPAAPPPRKKILKFTFFWPFRVLDG